MEAKERIRKAVRGRLALTSTGWRRAASGVILERLERLEEFNRAQVVAIYWSLPDEVQTHGFVERWSRTKTLLLPVVQGENMTLHPFAGRNKMSSGRYRIAQPDTAPWTELEKIDLLIVPGVAFDPHGARLGRGKGFYDRLLTNLKAPRVGLCFELQLFNEIPTEAHDQPMHRIISGNPLMAKCYSLAQ